MERLEAEIRRELGRFGPAAGIAALVEAWPQAVGDAIARNAWPARVTRDGTLVVHAKDSVWAFELAQRADEIRERLGPAAPAKLRFVAGPVPEPAAEAPVEASARAPQPGPEQLVRAEQLAASIDDENLRNLVAKTAALSLARAADDRSLW
jgi:hypothetical protein